ncbi:MAG TPA: non-heme iron oxygenase ferredoxin subunit [Acidimicrobiales bacterium]|nr:non-heme iron oxygenase ferredoxin subunit [Acidimicrobiales bacterium]
MGESVRVCGREEVAPGSARRFEIGDRVVALVRIDADEFYAVDDTCSHEDYSLAEGEVLTEEREIECWKHGSTFDLRTGDPCSLPATKPVEVYMVRVEGDDVMLELP